MPDIKCPRCEGKGSVMVTVSASGLHGAKTEIDCCPLCDGDLTISNRRAPTANDRAVEKVRIWINSPLAFADDEFRRGHDYVVSAIRDIIREEANRG